MSQPRSDIVQGGAARDDRVGGPLVVGQQHRDPTVLGVEQLGEVTVGEQSPLFVGLLAQAEGLVQHPLGRREAVDAPLYILSGGEVEEDGDQLGIDEALSLPRWVVDADGHPEDLPVPDVVVGPHVFDDDFQDHISTQLTDARSADAPEVLGDPMGQGIPQRLAAERAEFLADEVGSATHGRPSHERFFFRRRRNRS